MNRPKTREDCKDIPRPCPFVSCRHHLYLDVHGHSGRLVLHYPGKEPWELMESCALDVADSGKSKTMDVVAGLLGMRKQNVNEVLKKQAFPKLRIAMMDFRYASVFGCYMPQINSSGTDTDWDEEFLPIACTENSTVYPHECWPRSEVKN